MEDFALSMVSGELVLRDSEDPFALSGPTTITGTNTDGVLTGVDFSTPDMHIALPVENPPTTAEIDVRFSQAAPATGSVNESGEMTVRLSLAVDLHIEVGILPDPRDCRAAPVNLTLSSTSPYDPESGRVTLAVPNFSIPAVGVSAAPFCDGLIAERVNAMLAGPGHALRLTLEGPLTLPALGEPTATVLTVAPSGSSRAGQEVTLTATVSPNPVVPGAPPITGEVAFFDGDRDLGTAPVGADGVATLATSALVAGPRQVSARYLGGPPDWEPSTASPVAHAVIADPAVTSTLSGLMVTGGAPKAFDLTVVNTGFGAALDEDTEVRLTIARAAGGFAPLGGGGTSYVTLRRTTGGTPVNVPLAVTGSTLTGVVPGVWDLAPGEEHVENLDIAASSTLDPGPLVLTFQVVAEPGPDEIVLGRGGAEVTAVRPERQATTITAGLEGFPPFFPTIPPVVPLEARQGNNLEVYNLTVLPDFSGMRASGTIELSIDGRPLLARIDVNGAYVRKPTLVNGGTYGLLIPDDIAPGERTVLVKYSGDAHFLPSQAAWPVTILPSVGASYECIGQGFGQSGFAANVVAQALVPSRAATGTDLHLAEVEVELTVSRTSGAADSLIDVLPASDAELGLEVGPGGSVTFAEIEAENTTPMIEDDGSGPDHVITFRGGTGAVPVDAAPGEVVDLTVDFISATVTNSSGFRSGIVCGPRHEAVVLGTMTAAGTTLVVEPGDVVGEGRPVALTATALPATPGVVEFRDGNQTIGVVPVDEQGQAAMTTRDLLVGTRSLTARFFGGVVATLPSAPVELRVAACGAAAEPGNGAVVRLVYLELLGRCPDAAGYRHWKGRLDGGASREVFARSIARTAEAVGRVVDDAYQAMLGRPADAAGRVFWTRRLQASGRYDRLLADLAASGEFWSKAGSSNNGSVTRIYERLLGRSPDQGGLDYWVGRLDGGVSRRALVLALANQSEPLGVLVDDAHDEILDRKPTAAERTAGIAHLRSTGDRSGLYAQLVGTQEFADRAQGLPDPA